MLAVCGNVDYVYSFPPSPPSRAAWIEMLAAQVTSKLPAVAAFTGGVDRNTTVGDYKRNVPVAASQVVWIEALRLCDLPSLGIFINQNRVTAF